MTTTSTNEPQRVALVAGASRGIGAETAKAFAREGYAVVIGARDADALARVADQIEGEGGRAVAAKTDVGDVDSMRALVERAGEEAQRMAGASVPMGRIGTSQEVADVVLWLCSDRSSFVTGATIPIDGGQLAGHKPPRMYRQGEGMAPA